MKQFRVFTFVLVTCLCGVTVSAVADDWPRWMGPGGDGVWQEMGMLDAFPDDGPDIVWRMPIGAGYAGPSVSMGRVFVMDRTEDEGKGIKTENNIRAAGTLAGGERIRCLDFKTGETIWEHKYDCPYRIAYPTGPRCTVNVDDDGQLAYALGAMGHLKCLKAENGELVWEKQLTEDYEAKPPLWGYAAHPTIDGEQLIVPTGGEGSGLVAFNRKTGEEIWKSVTTFDIGYAPLVIYAPDNGPRQLIFWHGAGVTSVNPKDGSEFWFVKFPDEKNASVVTIATPVIVGNRMLISEFYKGSLLLELSADPPAAKEIWRDAKKKPRVKESMNCMMTTPVVKDGLAYGVAFSGRGMGVMRCIDVATGAVKWTDDKWIGDKPLLFASGFVTPNENKYFVFSDIGELIVGELNADGFSARSRAQLLEPTSVARGRDVVWSHPAYANGCMIARNDKEIICVNLKKK